MVPVESGLPSTWAATEDNKFKWVLASKGFGCDELVNNLPDWVSCEEGIASSLEAISTYLALRDPTLRKTSGQSPSPPAL